MDYPWIDKGGQTFSLPLNGNRVLCMIHLEHCIDRKYYPATHVTRLLLFMGPFLSQLVVDDWSIQC